MASDPRDDGQGAGSTDGVAPHGPAAFFPSSSGKTSSSTSNGSAQPAGLTPADAVLKTLDDAVYTATNATYPNVVQAIEAGLNTLLSQCMENASDGSDPLWIIPAYGPSSAQLTGLTASRDAVGELDKASIDNLLKEIRNQDGATQSAIRTALATYRVGLKTNTNTESSSIVTAQAALTAARTAWDTARSAYALAVESAQITLETALITSVNSYELKTNKDSQSRRLALYHNNLQTGFITELQTYETTLTTSAATLATAAGTLLSAFATYVTAVETALVTRLAADATTKGKFWTAVEGSLDAS